MDSTPAHRFSQNWARLLAPGKRPAMPMMAMPSGILLIIGSPRLAPEVFDGAPAAARPAPCELSRATGSPQPMDFLATGQKGNRQGCRPSDIAVARWWKSLG